MYLKTSSQRWDVIALSAAEITLLFCTLTLITGALWGKAEWDKYWRWEDLRLVTYLILWLILCAYLGLRSSIGEPEKRARLASVFGIVGFVSVPMSYFSMYIWRTLHPVVVSPGGGGLNEQMRFALILAFITFLLFLSYMMVKRTELEELEQGIDDIKESMEGIYNG
jgi:heme exporter protein C